MSRRRFLHIEAPRPGKDAENAANATSPRFEELATMGAEPSPAILTGHEDPTSNGAETALLALGTVERPASRPGTAFPEDLEHNARLESAGHRSRTHDRFAPAPPPLAVAERSHESLPFQRCADCGVDSNRFAPHCQHCGADLGTGAQRAFQAQVFAQHREATEREAVHSAEFARAQAELAQQEAEARRAYAEALARSTGARERARLSMEEDPQRSPGRWLLARIPAGWHKRVILGVLGLLATVLLIALAFPKSGLRGPAFLLIGICVSLFLPNRRRWPRRWW